MEREDDPQLWDLLSRSKAPEPSPFFARNVVRAVRNESASVSPLASWLQLRRLVPSFSALAAVVIAAFTFHTLHQQHRSSPAGNQMVVAEVSDADLATDLDVLTGEDDSDDAPLL
jgi:hypothetical protein